MKEPKKYYGLRALLCWAGGVALGCLWMTTPMFPKFPYPTYALLILGWYVGMRYARKI